LKKLLLALILTLTTINAQASLLIDPYIGTGLMKTTYDLGSLDDDSDNLTAVGARVGYQFLLLSAGIDYSKGSGGDFNFTNTSVFVGVDLPILLRAWAEYFLASSLDSDSSALRNADFEFKDGVSLGIGFTALPFVSLNLEVQNINYETEVSGVEFDFETAAYIFSVSLPLNL